MGLLWVYHLRESSSKVKKKKKFENADFLSFVILRSNQQTKGERSRECNSGDGSKQDGDSAVLIK